MISRIPFGPLWINCKTNLRYLIYFWIDLKRLPSSCREGIAETFFSVSAFKLYFSVISAFVHSHVSSLLVLCPCLMSLNLNTANSYSLLYARFLTRAQTQRTSGTGITKAISTPARISAADALEIFQKLNSIDSTIVYCQLAGCDLSTTNHLQKVVKGRETLDMPRFHDYYLFQSQYNQSP